MRTILSILTAISVLFLLHSDKHVPTIKTHATETWAKNGFEIVGCEGYQWGAFDTYGGKVWYLVRRVPDTGVLYSGCLTKWGDEFHIYNLKAIDAIKPH